jgi:hypothetical protein
MRKKTKECGELDRITWTWRERKRRKGRKERRK